ncbi:MAG TPA: hypothetical protein VHE09_15415 [Rhizomicrobium sp.]|jgi:hypothetical protein|nr:hypothetical protein [Rhizomicrobium sp.]
MALSKVLLLASAAALVSSAALAGPNVSRTASGVTGFHGVKAPTKGQKYTPGKGGKCGTGFGAELPTPDGLIGWNDTSGSGFDTGSGTDFTCTKKTAIHEVDVYGYNAPANPEQYNVTIYKNDTAGGSDEAKDGKSAKCSYTGILAEGGGSYPTHVLSHIMLPTKCVLKPGKYWVEVQDNDANGPWYHEMTSNLSGTQADWVDRNNLFGSGCTTLDNNAYLSNCLGYTYPDYMLELH